MRCVIALAFAAVAAFAQGPAAFEVASLHRHATAPGQDVYRRVNDGFGADIQGNRVSARMDTLTDLIAAAYDVRDFQVINAPDWAKAGSAAEYYDLAAKAPGDAAPTVDQVRRMLQVMLADRFQLQFHRGTKEMQVYNLVAGKGGPKLRDGSTPPPQADPGVFFLRSGMPLLINMISSRVARPVLDKTGLTGTYVYPWHNAGAAADTSIFALIEDELGLKLEAAKAQVETLVIDHAERPSEN